MILYQQIPAMSLQTMVDPPLSQRVFHTRHPGVPLPESSGNRPHQYKLWSNDMLKKACDEIRRGTSLRRAELEYGIPKSTLQGYASGKHEVGQSGHRRYLSNEEEAELVTFLSGCAEVGYARSRKQVIATVQNYLTDVKGLSVTLTNGWWDKFRMRHPELSIRTAERLTYSRAIAGNPEVLGRYLETLQHTLTKYGILNVSNQIFNCDESGFPLDYKSPQVIAHKKCKHPTTIVGGDKSQVTVLACVSAAGIAMPPMVIFDRKTMKQELAYGEVPGTLYGLTDNGWSNSEMFHIWFQNHFLRYIPAVRPIIIVIGWPFFAL